MGEFSIKDGEFLVRTARQAIKDRLEDKRTVIKCEDKFKENRGVFVTLKNYPDLALRGCIGFPKPIKPLIEALKKAAIDSAISDPRFPKLKKQELDKVVVEVTVLTEPKELTGDPKEYPQKVEVGKHGLIAEYGPYSGILLPQVAVEFEWDAEQFLTQTCWKAGFDPTCWLDPKVKLYKFEGQIFSEETPGGSVIEE